MQISERWSAHVAVRLNILRMALKGRTGVSGESYEEEYFFEHEEIFQ